jgi:hypothetical protein
MMLTDKYESVCIPVVLGPFKPGEAVIMTVEYVGQKLADIEDMQQVFIDELGS